MEEVLDSYLSITDKSQAEYTEKRSKFLAFAFPVKTQDEIKEIVAQYEKDYYDARHVCYAYMLGHERLVFRAVDNGEPSGTAGKPILGQINSSNLTDILIIVVRYFGGIKLGTSGLIQAYKTAAAAAIENANIQEYTVDDNLDVSFEYPLMNSVMRVVKEENPRVLGQDFDNNCILHLSIRRSLVPNLMERFKLIRGVTVKVLSICTLFAMFSCANKEQSIPIFSDNGSLQINNPNTKSKLNAIAKKHLEELAADSLANDSINNSISECYRWDREFQAVTKMTNEDGSEFEMNIIIDLDLVEDDQYAGSLVLYIDDDNYVEAAISGKAEGNHINIYYVENKENTTRDLFKDKDKLVKFELADGEYSASWYESMANFVDDNTILSIR